MFGAFVSNRNNKKKIDNGKYRLGAMTASERTTALQDLHQHSNKVN